MPHHELAARERPSEGCIGARRAFAGRFTLDRYGYCIPSLQEDVPARIDAGLGKVIAS
jgi:hypothetical protein